MKFLIWCRKYITFMLVMAVTALIYFCFMRDRSIERISALTRETSELRQQIKECNDTAAYYRELNRHLNDSPEEMERIARERYHMQGPGEDVFIVTTAE